MPSMVEEAREMESAWEAYRGKTYPRPTNSPVHPKDAFRSGYQAALQSKSSLIDAVDMAESSLSWDCDRMWNGHTPTCARDMARNVFGVFKILRDDLGLPARTKEFESSLPHAPPPESKSSLIDEGAIADIAAERERQISKEGWTPEHDDKHNVGELAAAASCYAMGDCKIYLEVEGAPNQVLKIWPWDDEWWNPKDERRNLVRAGALIAAEIERLDRLAKLGERT